MDFFQQIDNIALLEPAAHFELFRSISNAKDHPAESKEPFLWEHRLCPKRIRHNGGVSYH